jgi:hypothetical protein
MLAVVVAALPSTASAGELERYAPHLHYDAAETHFAQPVSRQYDEPQRVDRDLAYGHVATEDGERWLQYWLFFADNTQDRGLVATGRHEGDWEFAQFRLAEGAIDAATFSQHSSAEACAASEVEFEDGAPVVYVANASHALYPRAGTGDRPWPDPNDEAGGDGREVRPAVEAIADGSPGWVAFDGRWGSSRASWVPGEQSSPVGPAFQESGAWDRPASYHRAARECGSSPPGPRWAVPALIGLAAAALAFAVLTSRRRSQA